MAGGRPLGGFDRTFRHESAAILVVLLVLWAAPSAGAARGDVLAGPVPAVVEDVIDGDSLKVRAHIWLGQDVAVHVRLAGVDAPYEPPEAPDLHLLADTMSVAECAEQIEAMLEARGVFTGGAR